MENPEEILHSLEEFAKMKPKDIPRELEEYLKFVAKTGDPVYQWSAIKSLFREKLINVITEFYESCSSMEILPCPNVEMFNYDLMKNFILEKLDTFAAAPFTLQRICELLTSPRKEYTRIDKYMRALEKNILVVSTMEPGGRRTENGDGIMNGIESDHQHVPEPGNEINVEEMDDSPSWPQNIQTNNHISEHISFDNPTENSETPYHVSSSNQEIVCVQYVSVDPLVTETPQSQNEEKKETDISVTIMAVNKEDENQETPDTEIQLAKNIQKETTLESNETANKPQIETDTETKMDIQQPTESIKIESSNIDKTDEPSDPLSTEIQLTENIQKETTTETNETANKTQIETEEETKMDIQQPTEPTEIESSNTDKTDEPSDPLSTEILTSTTSEKPSQEPDQPLLTEAPQSQNEEQKDTDISVTITAVNKEEENQETPDTKIQLDENIQKATISESNETANKPQIETDGETKMDVQQPTESIKIGSSNIDKTDEPSDPLSTEILTSTTSENPSQEPDQPQSISLESENAETDTVSPETSVTSSDNSPSEPNASSDAPSNDINTENISSRDILNK